MQHGKQLVDKIPSINDMDLDEFVIDYGSNQVYFQSKCHKRLKRERRNETYKWNQAMR